MKLLVRKCREKCLSLFLIDEKTLVAAKKALTVSMGPIAAMMVSRTAKKVNSPVELRDALASEIVDEKERKAFLAAFPASN